MMQPTTLALHSPSDAVYELYICRILSASSPTTTYMCCNKQTHYKDLVQKLVMCGIVFYFGSVFEKNTDLVQADFGSVQIEKRGSVCIL